MQTSPYQIYCNISELLSQGFKRCDISFMSQEKLLAYDCNLKDRPEKIARI